MNPKERLVMFFAVLTIFTFLGCMDGYGADLEDIQQSGVIRHLGVPYANFVTGSGDGLDVELSMMFAEYIGVKYQYVKTSWKDVISDLTGKKVKVNGNDVDIVGETPCRGDFISNGLTILPWRKKLINYSTPIFPTQVWIIMRADAGITPIIPTGDVHKDIMAVKRKLTGCSVLGVANTCLDPTLYRLEEAGAKTKLFTGNLNEIAPAVINLDAESSVLDVPDALIALEKWAGKIKVIGPVSEQQVMGTGFPKDAPNLLAAYNKFLTQCKRNGTYLRLIKKYYPAVFSYYPEFFKNDIKK